MALAFHFMHRLVDGRVILGTPALRADAYRRVRRIGTRYGLLFFHLGTDHIHAVVACEESDVPRFAQAIECSITRGTRREVGFGRYHAKVVADQGHLQTLVRYVLTQEQRHGTAMDPRHHGSNGPDLIGGRIGGEVQRELFARYLPKVTAEYVQALLFAGTPRVPLEELGPAPGGLVGAALEELLRLAAAAAIGCARLGRRGRARSARRVLLEIVEKMELGETVVPGRLLGSSRHALRRLRLCEIDLDVGRAVRWQIEFFAALATGEATRRS